VSRRQANRWAGQEQQQQQDAYYSQQYEQQQQPPPQPVPVAAPAAAPDPIAQLKDLADLRDKGILTDAEFQAQKAKILGS
jgi:hypothetical protein